jgi:hypothetical protein
MTRIRLFRQIVDAAPFFADCEITSFEAKAKRVTVLRPCSLRFTAHPSAEK